MYFTTPFLIIAAMVFFSLSEASKVIDNGVVMLGIETQRNLNASASININVSASDAMETQGNLNVSALYNINASASDVMGNSIIGPTPTTAPVDLGIACNFTILTKSGVTTTGVTSVIGNMGTSPIAVTAITGFAMTLAGDHSTSSIVTGNIYAANHAVPTPAMMTTAIYDMEAAYVDTAGRAGPGPVTVGLGVAGDISGLVLEPGIYKWSTTVKVDTNLTFNGDFTDIWILQIAGTFTVGPGATILLAGGAKAENIYWAIAGVVAFDDGSHGEGIFLAQTMISFNAGSSLHGAALAQNAVTMIATEISGACNMSSSSSSLLSFNHSMLPSNKSTSNYAMNTQIPCPSSSEDSMAIVV